MQNRKKRIKIVNLAVIFLYFAVFFTVYGSFVFNNRIMVNADGSGYFAFKCFLANAFKAGELPLWNPFIGIGNPYLADVQNAVFDPTNILYIFLNPVLAFNLAYIIKLVCAAFFMYLLIKEITDNFYSSVAAGFIYGFSGMLGGVRVEHVTIITTIVFFPLIMYMMEKYRKSLNIRYLLASSVIMALQFMTGFTQIVLYFNIILFIYYIYINISEKILWKKGMIRCGLWIGAYLLLIAIQLLPLVKLMRNSLIGDKSFAAFASLSCDLRVILLMFFPQLFSNYYSPWASQASTGIDIELYVGVIGMIYMIYIISYNLKKEREVQIFLALGIGAFLYALLPQIPVINQILYRMPVLGSFRVAGRSMIIFVFFAVLLLSLGLSKMETKEDIRKVIKVNLGFIIIIAVLLFAVWAFFSQDSIRAVIDTTYYNSFIKQSKLAIILPLVHLACLLAVYFIPTTRAGNVLFLGIVTLMIIGDVGKYSVVRAGYDGDSLTASTTDTKILAFAQEDTAEGYRSFAMEDTFYKDSSIDIYQYNKSSMLGLTTYNNYITFLDPKLKYWGIAETAAYPGTNQMVRNRNDLISMLSIRHIIDNGNSSANIADVITARNFKNIFEICDQILPGGEQTGAVAYEITGVKPNSQYEISMTMTTADTPTVFYVDFYGDNYDDPAQDAIFPSVKTEGQRMTTTVSTSEITTDKLYLRVIYQNNSDIKINCLEVKEIEGESVYKAVLNANESIVYENVNARKLIYVPDRIYSIDDYKETCLDTDMQNVDRNNYIIDYGKTVDLTDTDTEISNFKMGYNYVRADVRAGKDTFINFSQLYTSGWNGYVDGKKVKLYNVNNLIQGIEVPEGQHVVEFHYEPAEVYVGMIISLLSVISLAVYFMRGIRGGGAGN